MKQPVRTLFVNEGVIKSSPEEIPVNPYPEMCPSDCTRDGCCEEYCVAKQGWDENKVLEQFKANCVTIMNTANSEFERLILKHVPEACRDYGASFNFIPGMYDVTGKGLVMEVKEHPACIHCGAIYNMDCPDDGHKREYGKTATLSFGEVEDNLIKKMQEKEEDIDKHLKSKRVQNTEQLNVRVGEVETKKEDWVTEQVNKFKEFLDTCPKDKMDALLKEVESVGTNGPTVDEYFNGLSGHAPEVKQQEAPDFEKMIDKYQGYFSNEGLIKAIWKEHVEPKWRENRQLEAKVWAKEQIIEALQEENARLKVVLKEAKKYVKKYKAVSDVDLSVQNIFIDIINEKLKKTI